MPKTKSQKLVFGILMSVFMACGMELYNISLKQGGFTCAVFLPALREISYMWIVVLIVSSLVGNRIGQALAFRHVTPGQDNPFFITLMISGCTVLVMCPIMSMIASILFHGVNEHLLTTWVSTVARNFPMAILWQIFFAGPLVRLIFRTLYRIQPAAVSAAAQAE